MPRPVIRPEPLRDPAVCKNISLPKSLWKLLEKFRRDRMDSSLSASIRFIVLDWLSLHGYTEEETRKAYDKI